MKWQVFLLTLLMAAGTMAQDKKLRVIAIGAHPDDCDLKFGGTAIKLAAAGHAVKFLSVTNGDAGHHEMAGGTLARRRYLETQEAARRFGIAEYQVLDNHDAELEPVLAVRKQIIRAIRDWKADVVVAPRPNDYHPDHRYTGVLVQDAAFLVVVPNVVADSPALRDNPVFLYYQDGFQKPAPFRPDVVVAIDDVWERKVNALDAHVSQFYEWLPWLDHRLDQVPREADARRKWLGGMRAQSLSEAAREAAARRYGAERARTIRHAESFELCEYGRRPGAEELSSLFPR
ncbi:MAG: PIG-L family deacetylase [Bryobacterales bacterium]|nr:PIG-L family deacetylase [Bryobacterales bacterium]